MKIGLTIVAAALIIAMGALIAIQFMVPPQSPPLTGSVNVRVINGATEVNLTFNDLLNMNPIQGISSYQNRDMYWIHNGTYMGVPLATIIDGVGGMDANDIVRVNASDGYHQYFAYYNIYPNTTFHAIQGDLILAFVYNGRTPPGWADGARIAFLPPDNAYSNDDANQTTHPAFFGRSAGSRWVRNVISIEILHDMYPPMKRLDSPLSDSRKTGIIPPLVYGDSTFTSLFRAPVSVKWIKK